MGIKRKFIKIITLSAVLCAVFATCSFAVKVKATATLNVRKSPSTSSAVITKMPKGTVRTVKGTSGNWYKIVMNSKTGYISADYAKKVSSGSSSGSSNVSTWYTSGWYDLQSNYPTTPYRTKSGAPAGATIKSGGCCPTALGNILRNKCKISSATTTTMCKLATSSGARMSSGTSASMLLSASKKRWGGFTYRYTSSTTEMRKFVADGGMALAHTRGSNNGSSSLFSSGGHFVAVISARGTNLKVADPLWYEKKWTTTATRRANIRTSSDRGVVYTTSYAMLDACDYYYLIK